MPGSRASATGSSNQSMPSRRRCRGRCSRSRAADGGDAIGRPQRTARSLPWRSIRRTSDAPTVPRPARPSRSGAFMTVATAPTGGEISALALAIGTTLCNVLSADSRKRRTLRAAWRMRCSFSTSAMRTYSSPCSPKPMPGRDRDVGLLDQQLGELERAERAELLRDRRPGEHRGRRRRESPSRRGRSCRPARRGGACRSRASRRCSPAGR